MTSPAILAYSNRCRRDHFQKFPISTKVDMSGASMKTMIAAWETAYSDAVWQKLESVKSSVRIEQTPPSASNFLTLGPTLPDAEEPRVAEVVAHRHEDSAEIYWVLTTWSAPDGEPPAHVKESNTRIGSRKGLAQLLADCLPIDAPDVATFQIRLLVDGSSHKCRSIPAAPLERGGLHDAALSLGREVRLEQVGYRFEVGTQGIEEIAIVYLHKKNAFSVSISANGLLKLKSTTWLPYADEVADLVLNTFFSTRAERQ